MPALQTWAFFPIGKIRTFGSSISGIQWIQYSPLQCRLDNGEKPRLKRSDGGIEGGCVQAIEATSARLARYGRSELSRRFEALCYQMGDEPIECDGRKWGAGERCGAVKCRGGQCRAGGRWRSQWMRRGATSLALNAVSYKIPDDESCY